MKIDDSIFESLMEKAAASERLRMNYDLRNSSADGSQRMLNALLPGTPLPVHRHPDTSETVVCLKGSLDEIFYDRTGGVLRESERIRLDADGPVRMVLIPKGVWHTVEVFEPSIIFESKDGAYAPTREEDIIL